MKWLIVAAALTLSCAAQARTIDPFIVAEEDARVCMAGGDVATCMPRILYLTRLCLASYGRDQRDACNRYVNQVIGLGR